MNTVRESRRRPRTLLGSVAVALVAAVAMVTPSALAADKDAGSSPKPGTYTVTANLYVDKADTPIHKNAYVTNPGAPPLNPPTEPVRDNATLVVKDNGTQLLTVPIVNQTLGVLSIADKSTDDSVSITAKTLVDWQTRKGKKQRISSITFDVTKFAGGNSIAHFSPSAEFVNFPLYLGDKNWDLHLITDYNIS